ncbi:MAG: GlsB/YeaQ/YmgE family stress response membrane protein [Wenzhouxiangella sp.]
MTLEQLLIILLIGGIAGWVAGVLVRGRGHGIIVNIVVGIIGAFIGGWVFAQLGIATAGLLGSLVVATVGAIILLALLRLLKRAA